MGGVTVEDGLGGGFDSPGGLIGVEGGRTATGGAGGTVADKPASTGFVGKAGGSGRDGIKGGWGASGSGTRGAAVEAVGSGGRGVRAVSLKPLVSGETFAGAGIGWRLNVGNVPVEEGSAGGRLPCWIGSTPAGISTLPLLTKTLAAGLATITRGGIWPEGTGVPIGPLSTLDVAGKTGPPPARDPVFDGTVPVSGGALGVAMASPSRAVLGRFPPNGGEGGRGVSGVGRTRGWVLARVSEPVRDVDFFISAAPGDMLPVRGRGVCIGCVTAVDQAGGMFCEPVGPTGEGSGLRGLGGKLTRKVSRF